MSTYILKRLFYSLFVLGGLLTLVFIVTRVIGDPARLYLPIEASHEQYLALRDQLGLNDPLPVQYLRFLGDIVRGDFGQSLWQRVPALPLVLGRLPATITLAFTTIIAAALIAVPLGTLAALFPGSNVDKVVRILAFAAASMPEFWFALVLILIVAVRLDLLPTSGYGATSNLILPVATLSLRPVGRLAHVLRSSLLEEISKAYMVTAVAKGRTQRGALWKHAFRNALLPTLTLAGDELASLMNGAVVVETIFAWPGIGFLAIQAIERRDLPVVAATVAVTAIFVITINLIVDLMYSRLDPRIRL